MKQHPSDRWTSYVLLHGMCTAELLLFMIASIHAAGTNYELYVWWLHVGQVSLSMLLNAAEMGRTSLVRRYVENGGDLNAVNEASQQQNALPYAAGMAPACSAVPCRAQKYGTCKFTAPRIRAATRPLSALASQNVTPVHMQDGDSLVMYAAGTGNVHLLVYLLDACPRLVSKPNASGLTPMHVACMQGFDKVVSELLAFGSPGTVGLHVQNPRRRPQTCWLEWLMNLQVPLCCCLLFHDMCLCKGVCVACSVRIHAFSS